MPFHIHQDLPPRCKSRYLAYCHMPCNLYTDYFEYCLISFLFLPSRLNPDHEKTFYYLLRTFCLRKASTKNTQKPQTITVVIFAQFVRLYASTYITKQRSYKLLNTFFEDFIVTFDISWCFVNSSSAEGYLPGLRTFF